MKILQTSPCSMFRERYRLFSFPFPLYEIEELAISLRCRVDNVFVSLDIEKFEFFLIYFHQFSTLLLYVHSPSFSFFFFIFISFVTYDIYQSSFFVTYLHFFFVKLNLKYNHYIEILFYLYNLTSLEMYFSRKKGRRKCIFEKCILI